MKDIGLKDRKEYLIKNWNPDWVQEFNQFKKIILPVFKDNLISFEHVGSTSINGMCAKPMIDILIIVHDLELTEEVINEMKYLGYILYKDYIASDSILFAKELEGKRIQNIHVLPYGHEQIIKFIIKRDYFRNSKDAVERYIKLKHSLMEKYPDNYVLYREGKKDFLNKIILDESIEWVHRNKNQKYWDFYDLIGISGYLKKM